MLKIPFAIQPKIVKLPSGKDNAPSRPLINGDSAAEIATVAAYWTKRTAIGVAVLYTGKRVLDTSTEIALIAAKAHFK